MVANEESLYIFFFDTLKVFLYGQKKRKDFGLQNLSRSGNFEFKI